MIVTSFNKDTHILNLLWVLESCYSFMDKIVMKNHPAMLKQREGKVLIAPGVTYNVFIEFVFIEAKNRKQHEKNFEWNKVKIRFTGKRKIGPKMRRKITSKTDPASSR
jgi:hypothetical protein